MPVACTSIRTPVGGATGGSTDEICIDDLKLLYVMARNVVIV
jgi:hypothetical protein